MQLHRDLAQLPAFQKAVVTIGSFDGVHAGHREILRRVIALAKEQQGESVVVTFDPHPRMVLMPGKSVSLLTSIEEKAALLQDIGIDHLVIAPFTTEFAKQTPEDYVRHFLVEKLHPQALVIGYDHRFGNDRTGDISLLETLAPQFGYLLEEIPRQMVDDIAVSSTKIRQAIEAGDVESAAAWLGHPYTLSGTVTQGDQIGRTIGYPTANLHCSTPHKLIPQNGIYAVRVRHQSTIYGGMLYIGHRPVIGKDLQRVIEVNIFEFDQDIYGHTLSLEFLSILRQDQSFDSLEALQRQLAHDKENALSVLSASI